jgi:hypothetical protein
MFPAPGRSLLLLAWINVALHVLGLVLALVGIRPGTPLVELAQRRDYVAGSPLGWSLGWAVWMLCALVLVGFFAALGRYLPPPSETARLALVLAGAGAAIDLFCDAIYLTILPMVANPAIPDPILFLTVERLAITGGWIVANGLYSLRAFGKNEKMGLFSGISVIISERSKHSPDDARSSHQPLAGDCRRGLRGVRLRHAPVRGRFRP